MTTETQILTDVEIGAIIGRIYEKTRSKEIGELRFKKDVVAIGRAIEQAVLQSPEIQELRNLLKDARQQLPLAAQFWNEDDEPERGSRNVQRVMKLIAKIDALFPSTPARPESEQ